MDQFDILLEILEKSLEKNGDKPLTISHLINILKMLDRSCEKIEEKGNLIGSFYDANE